MKKSIITIMMAAMSFVVTIFLISVTTDAYSQQENQQQEEYTLIREWGSEGVASGQFSQPADIAIDSKGNVFVTDITARSNAVQQFNQNGTFISGWGSLGCDQGSFVRASYGEQITPDSWLMRNTWKKVNVKQGNRTGLAKKPIKFKGSGIRILMGRAWNIQNVRGILDKGEKRHEFKSTHGFRKFFKSTCEHAGMKSLHVEMLMGHSIGLAKNYYRPKENEILEDYLKSVPFLTINDEYRLTKQVQELREKNQDSEYVIKGKLQEKDKQIKKLEESVAFLSDRFNAFLLSQPGNKILYDDGNDDNRQSGIAVKGIELKTILNNKAVGTVIPTSISTSPSSNKKK